MSILIQNSYKISSPCTLNSKFSINLEKLLIFLDQCEYFDPKRTIF